MRVIGVAVVLALGLALAPLAVGAQQAGKVTRIGLLISASSIGAAPFADAFRQGLRELGYVEGKSLALEIRWGEGNVERIASLASELGSLKVDVIVAGGNQAIRAAKQATTMIPIVMANSVDPVADRFIASLARPGGNITGLSMMLPQLTGKRLELLKEVVPGIVRVAVLSNPANPSHASILQETGVAARGLGLTLQSLQVSTANDFEDAFRAAGEYRADALIVPGDALFNSHRTRIGDLAAKKRLPTMCQEREYVLAGGLMSYGPSYRDSYRRAAYYVDRILKGAKPADLPVEQPTKFELVINLKTAKALGLTIPQSILLRADQVIE